MKRSILANMRRMRRIINPTNLTKVSRSLQAGISDLVIANALAPITALTPLKFTSITPKAIAGKRSHGSVLKQNSGTTPRIPKGAEYLTRRHRSVTGSRGYKLYLPASQPKHPKGLIVMLHGCGQTPDDFAVGTHMNGLAEKNGLAIAYPGQTRRSNVASCWNWYKPINQRRGTGEAALLASLARKLQREFSIGQSATFVAGLSAGGAMAAILVDVYPDVFAAAGIHSGLTRGAAHSTMSAISAMRSGGEENRMVVATALPAEVRRIVFQGDADTTINPSNAPMIVAAALGDDAVPTKVTSRSVQGRGYVRSEYAGQDGVVLVELWMIEGAGHAWSGGRKAGSYTDSTGPDASAQMVRFFLA